MVTFCWGRDLKEVGVGVGEGAAEEAGVKAGSETAWLPLGEGLGCPFAVRFGG